MPKKSFTLTKILCTINEFNESVLEVMKETEYGGTLDLRHCIRKDTLHSFNGEKCYNCSFFEEPYVEISENDFRKFKKYFGKDFSNKLINLINFWPKENDFPFIYNSKLNTLPKHKKLIELYKHWNRLTKNEKIDEVLTVDSIQGQYFKALNKAEKIRKRLGMEFA